MTINYYIYMDAEISDEFLISAIEKNSSRESSTPYPLSADSIEVTDYNKEIIQNNFGFNPVCGFNFVLDKSASPEDSSKALILVSLEIIKNKDVSNSVLLFNGDTPIFHYDRKALLLNVSTGYWSEERIALLSVPYELKTIPIL